MERSTGLVIIGIGLVVVVVGALIWSGAFGWFGHLPGDLRFETENSRVFIPITSSVLASLALTVVLNLVLRLFR